MSPESAAQMKTNNTLRERSKQMPKKFPEVSKPLIAVGSNNITTGFDSSA